MTMLTTDNDMFKVLISKEEDFVPYGRAKRSENPPSPTCTMCSSFIALRGNIGSDWGVCINQSSHRKGLLTFELQGCKCYRSRFDEKH